MQGLIIVFGFSIKFTTIFLTFFGVKMIKNKTDKMLPSTNLQYTQAPTMHFLGLLLEKFISHIYLRNTRYDNHTSLVKPTKN